jgi:hypothetical protein
VNTTTKEFGAMNGNYEWNKQYARQRAQQRYREADLHRQARQNKAGPGPIMNYWRAIPAKIAHFVYRAKGLKWGIMVRRTRQS